ncbi:mitochondrial inner membrane protein required for protein import [Exophiala xenobiotica]|nr:mitochondrial inner membrane protein required for protein import [Exophiala xenobiotica]KAK5220587.1 mitochondrial inner membrane protein required for protein import [Exophiala xenobiotica]KAK5290860.1 mitochondrial inner membrane protein required for protein import [Exophiala xenobiotica]KAK5377442.1 mitochondrial inner membrane protein required for protein import [Exophiala xenobiotica]KAK5393451.1 mitochondrial inner membrane protein required for protein import [Exophiala xenobiotica]
MLSRAVLPLLRPQQARPLIPQALPQLRYYSRNQGIKGSDYRLPPSSHSGSSRDPLRKVPFTTARPNAKKQQPPDTPPFGVDPARDLDDVSGSVSKATRSSMREQQTQAVGPQEEKAVPQSSEGEAQQPQQPLPDLTKGIPSTLDAELSQAKQSQQPHARKSSLNITEEPVEQTPPDEGGEGRGDIPREQYVSSSDRKKNAVFRYMYMVLGLGAVGYSVYLGRNWESEEEERKHADAPSGLGLGLFWNRIQARLGSTMSYYRDPVTTKLLPDEDPDPNLRFPFTLVLSLEDMLCHSEWTREHGWRVAKRPGMDYFLRYLGSYYEIVLFTSQPMAMVEQVLRKLDPYSTIRWPLFREATLYKDGGYVKDLSYLNRDLKKVVIIDTDPHHVKHQPENAIILPKWKGDPKDQTLIQLIPFLEYVATMGFDDAREVLKSFEGTYIPAEFARREKILREKFEKQEAEKRKGKPKKSVGGLGSLLGLSKPQEDQSLGEGKMLWDQIRERGQQQYMEFDKKIKEEGEKWLAERDAEEKRMQEEAMKSMKPGAWFSGFFGGGNKPAEEKK